MRRFGIWVTSLKSAAYKTKCYVAAAYLGESLFSTMDIVNQSTELVMLMPVLAIVYEQEYHFALPHLKN
jgi:hypothetical protein